MLVERDQLRESFARVREGKASRHSAKDRVTPSRSQYDWLLLDRLASDITGLISSAASRHGESKGTRLAVDIGSFRCPYRDILEQHGFEVRTLGLSDEFGADLVGYAHDTGLQDSSIDLVLCTQVLERTPEPWLAMKEFHRIVKPSGCILVAVPHVWFYHPHPGDYWRLTPEGLTHLCSNSGFVVQELRLQGGTVAAVFQILNFVLYGVLGRFGMPVYWVMNALGDVLDRLLPNPLFTLNVACLARRQS